MNDMPQLNVKARRWLLVLWIVTVGLVAYSNSFDKVFLFDDYKVIKSYSPLEYVFGFNRRWFVNLTFAFNYLLDGYNEAGYHLVNLLVHIIAAILLFYLTRHFLYDSSMASYLGEWTDLFSALMASLWVAHPLQTESVTYICQRYESMMGMCILGFVYFGILYISHTVRIYFAIISLIFLIVGLGTKEVIVVAPFILLVYDYMFIGKSIRNIFLKRWIWHSLTISVVLINIVLLIIEVIRQARMTYDTVLYHVSTGKYLMTQSGVIFHYIRLSLWPDKLCLDKVWDPVNSIYDVWWQLPLVILLVTGTIVYVWKRKALGFVGIWFFGILAPTSSFIPISDIAVEHRMYLPLAAIVGLFIVGPPIILCYRLPGKRIKNFLMFSYFIVILLIIGGAAWKTIKRNEVYSSQETMWRDVIEKSPENYRQHISFIHALLVAGKIEKAENQVRELIHKMEDIAEKNIVLPKVKYNISYHAAAYNELGCIFMEQDRFEEALVAFNKANSLAPKAVYESNIIRALKLANKHEEAVKRCEKAVIEYPYYHNLHALLGILYADSGRENEAIIRLEKALEMDPSNILIKIDLARMLILAKQKDLRDYQKALRLLNDLEPAVGGQSHKVSYLKSLAYAGLGDQKNALFYRQKAIELLEKTGSVNDSYKEELINEYKAVFDLPESD